MQNIKGLEQIGSRAFYRPREAVELEQALRMGAAAIRAARELGLSDMLVDTTGLTGLGPMGAFQRYEVGSMFATAAGAQFSVAVLARPEQIDPQKIGILVAQNRNAMIDIFSVEKDAIAWLDARLRRMNAIRER